MTIGKRKTAALSIVSLVVLITVLCVSLVTDTPSTAPGLYFLDVGQGDATLIVTTEGMYGLIDTGPGDKVVTELQRVLGSERVLDFVLITHFDSDHAEGLLAVLDYYQVGRVFAPRDANVSRLEEEVASKVELLNIDLLPVDSASDFSLGCCLHVDVLWPLVGEYSNLSENDSSIATWIDISGISLYAAGDLSTEYELQSVYSLATEVDVDVLKVGHHGSRTSTDEELLEKLEPEVAVISAGKDNPYGHPHDTVLEALSSLGVSVMRTDQQGRISLTREGSGYKTCTEQSLCTFFDLD